MSEETGQEVNISPETSEAPASTWYDGAQDETVGYIQNKGWDNPIKAVEAYQNLEKFHGVPADQLLKLPKDFTQEGALDPIYNRLGRPETADGYKVELPEGLQIDEARMKEHKEFAHKLGLTQSQYEAIIKNDAEYYNKITQEAEQNWQQQSEAEYQQLMSEWGPKASEREELARRALKKALPGGSEDDLASIEQAIGTAKMLKMFANFGDSIREDKVPDSAGEGRFGYTKEQAANDRKELMEELKVNKERLNAYNSGKGPDYEKMQRLNKIMTS